MHISQIHSSVDVKRLNYKITIVILVCMRMKPVKLLFSPKCLLLQRNTIEYDSSLRLTNCFWMKFGEITCNYPTARFVFFFHDHPCSGTYFKIKWNPNHWRNATMMTNACYAPVLVIRLHETVVYLGQKWARLKPQAVNRRQASQPASSLCRGTLCGTWHLLEPPFYVPNGHCSPF